MEWKNKFSINTPDGASGPQRAIFSFHRRFENPCSPVSDDLWRVHEREKRLRYKWCTLYICRTAGDLEKLEGQNELQMGCRDTASVLGDTAYSQFNNIPPTAAYSQFNNNGG